MKFNHKTNSDTKLLFLVKYLLFKHQYPIMIDWLKRHVNLSSFILCLEIRELLLLYIHIYIFCVVISQESFVHNPVEYE